MSITTLFIILIQNILCSFPKFCQMISNFKKKAKETPDPFSKGAKSHLYVVSSQL